MNRRLGLGLLLAAVAALALRVPQLDLRPMHNDEAVNALKIQDLWEHGHYAYDPDEYHGPSLHYATLPFIWLSPARNFSQLSEKTLRLVTVVFGVALIFLLWLLRDGLGTSATLIAAGLTAISPAMVFYSRYFIHEMLLICFTLLVLAAGWRYTRTRHIGWAVVGGAGLGLMFATKETFVIAVGAMGLAALIMVVWNRRETARLQGTIAPGVRPSSGAASREAPLPDEKSETLRTSGVAAPEDGRAPGEARAGGCCSIPWLNPKHGLAAISAGAVVSVVLFTSFFTHPGGLVDSIRTYLPWLHRAAGHSPHVHPFYFYLERLAFFHHGRGPVWSEALILVLAAVGVVAAITRRGDANVALARFISLYAIILTLAYSAISYKTPWCLLGFLQPMIMLAGVGGAAIIQLFRRRLLQVIIGVALFVAAGHLGWLSWQTSYVFESDRRNPYVYAQTVPDLLDLVDKMKVLAKSHAEGEQMLIQVMAPQGDYWPLPWYLRRFKRVGWWDHVPEDLSAPVMIVGSRLCAALEKKPNPDWSALGIYGLRPGIVVQLYVRSDLQRRYLDSLSPRGP